MRARAANGYYVFQAPVGYVYRSVPGRGRKLFPDEKLAPILREALEGYASGRFELQAEVKRFLESHPEYPRDRSGVLRNQRVNNLLKRVVYAGYIEVPNWDVSLRPAQHEGIITFETYLKIQERLKGNAKVPARKNISADFPLRGAVVCGNCGNPFSACWSKGAMGVCYPYYLCTKKGCQSYRKSIRRADIEGKFEMLLRSLRPSAQLFGVCKIMFKDLWDKRLLTQKSRATSLEKEIAKAERQTVQLLDRIVDAHSPAVINAYEKRIAELETKKAEMKEKIASCGRPVRGFDESFRTAMDYLSNPYKLWASERLEDKRAVLKLTFADRLAYVKNEGF